MHVRGTCLLIVFGSKKGSERKTSRRLIRSCGPSNRCSAQGIDQLSTRQRRRTVIEPVLQGSRKETICLLSLPPYPEQVLSE